MGIVFEGYWQHYWIDVYIAKPKDSGKEIDTMANVSISFVVIEIEKLKIMKIEKYAFSVDIHSLLDQSTCGNNYHRNICMVIITTGTLV